jgi:spore germination protein YaaH
VKNLKKALFTIIISAAIASALQHPLAAAESSEKEASDKILVQEVPDADPAAKKEAQQSPVRFREVWGYLMRGEERVFRGDEPITDVCYFACGVSSGGRINTNVAPPELPAVNGVKRRVHMVIADLDNPRLMHYILDPEKKARDLVVKDIIELSLKFDGVQIDFEAVSGNDAANFLEFLRAIKAGLPQGKTFSIAVPPRVRKVVDAYDYKAISEIVDKIFIMAYDQHWSTSKPGPVASLPWCQDIVTYAMSEIPVEKLIMGIPLYGRVWRDKKVVKKIRTKVPLAKNGKKQKKTKTKTVTVTRYVTESRAIKTSHLPNIVSARNAVKEYSPENGFRIKYNGKSNEILYCDDIKAIMEKFSYYSWFVDSIGFWRLGQENPDIWKEIELKEN